MTDNPMLQDRTSEAVQARVTDMVIRLTVLGLFTYAALTLVAPFFPILVWAIILTVALYPVYEWLAARLGGRPKIAALLVTLIALAIVSGPLGMLAGNLAGTVVETVTEIRAGTFSLPAPPEGVRDWPLVGRGIEEVWTLAATNVEAALAEYGPALKPYAASVVGDVASIGADILLFTVSIILAGFLFVPGPRIAAGARQFAARIAQPRGAQFVDLAGATIRGVSRGVVGVAFLQALLAGIIFSVAGVPAAGLLAFAVLVLCIVQVGPALVLLPVIIWAWMTMPTVAALALTICLVPILVIDNVLKPILIARGLTTPALVILTGVIGGTIGYGLMGLFLGPIVLAVFYELVVAWVRLGSSKVADAPPDSVTSDSVAPAPSVLSVP
jgi:predicted PurR-regulated permease PerM